MLHATFDDSQSIITLEPNDRLSSEDFIVARRIIDGHFSSLGQLKGIIIQTASFPGWVYFQAFLGHLKFTSNGPESIEYVAVLTNSSASRSEEKFANHFVNANIRRFPLGADADARDWILQKNQ